MTIDSLRGNEALPGLCHPILCMGEEYPPPPIGSHLEPQRPICPDCRIRPLPERCDQCREPLRGCQYPGCESSTRYFVTFEGLDYCHEHIGVVKSGSRFRDAVKSKTERLIEDIRTWRAP